MESSCCFQGPEEVVLGEGIIPMLPCAPDTDLYCQQQQAPAPLKKPSKIRVKRERHRVAKDDDGGLIFPLSPTSQSTTYIPQPPQKKLKRKRPAEFDTETGEWVDVRRFDRMPITIEEAEISESSTRVPHGAYFVSLAHTRISGIIQLHDRWLKKTKNVCSDYAAVQHDLKEFFEHMLAEFNGRYVVYTTHPQFESIGKTRKRTPTKKSDD